MNGEKYISKLHWIWLNIYFHQMDKKTAKLNEYYKIRLHCVKSVQIRTFFWFLFFYIQFEYRKRRTRKNYVFRHFSYSAPASTEFV